MKKTAFVARRFAGAQAQTSVMGSIARVAIVAALTATTLAPAVDASAEAQRRTRTATRTYAAPGARVLPFSRPVDVAHCDGSSAAGCVEFRTRTHESRVRVSVMDASRTGPVLASIAQDLDGDGVVEPDEHITTFCGRSERVWIRRPARASRSSYTKRGPAWSSRTPG